MLNSFTFAGINSLDYGVGISGTGVFNAPRRVYESVHVPGRNGDLILRGDEFENIEVTYPAVIQNVSNISGLRNALLSKQGYFALTDTYNPGETRYGCYMDGFTASPIKSLDGADFNITFNCKPQRFLDSGNTVISKSTTAGTYATMDVTNSTPYTCYPLIKITGYGSITFKKPGDATFSEIEIENIFPYVVIDSDSCNCYYEGQSANEYITFWDSESLEFPILKPGVTSFTIPSVSGNNHITKVEVTPRWFIL